ncbi:hypothetical protein BKA65DRAFT_472252 [Rhexocercosporidium sp. MPI-PUGE-AT-0058]|nr:hypothetical protein BKA65DRAFT_472252 [Rhexocercosporidium sp. MPI-PUGE-AT-0058]
MASPRTLTIARPRAERTPSSLRLQPKPQPQPQSYNSPSLPASKSYPQQLVLPPTHQQQAQPKTSMPAKSRFKILIHPTSPSSSKNKHHLQLTYLTPNGSTTPSKSLAALCHLSHSSRLYCGNFVTPISAPVGAPAALFSSVRGVGGEGLEKGVVSLGFVVGEGLVRWKGRIGGVEGEAGWVVKGDGRGGESVWAVFGDKSASFGGDSVGVELRVDYEM